MAINAVVLFSGGLDSLLAVKTLQEQNVTVTGLNLVTPFHDCSQEAAARAEELGIELVVRTLGDDYMAMLKKPRFGVGKAVNPCIDCRILMCREAKKLMEERAADFVATGEISGQRPNSQMMHQLNLITRESGLGGKLVRPLCAKVLPPTEPEIEEQLDREKLLSLTGRGRGRLINKARYKYGIKSIPQPSTGCLLCEKSFAPRVADLLRHTETPTVWDAALLSVGRHLRIDPRVKAVVARREADCDALFALYARSDRSRSTLLAPYNFNGPAALLVGELDAETTSNAETVDYLAIAGGLILRFTRSDKLESPTPSVRLFSAPETWVEYKIAPNRIADTLTMIQECSAADI